jgi:DNA-binding transcriptional regulator YdaS (Cro superfamily)
MAKDSLKMAIEIVGGQSELGRAIGVTQQRISKWLLSAREPVPPAEFVRAIVAAVDARGKRISAHELRPDIYPDGFEFPSETSGQAAAA